MPKQNIDADGLGLNGYDPVSYFDGNDPVEGIADFTTEHGGVTYRFSSAANQEKFDSAPEKYAPQYGGFCAVAASEGKYFDVNPKTYTIQDGRLYLFYNGDQGNTLPQWQEDPEGRRRSADSHWAADDLVDPA